ncbi:MAG TPA: biotin transporter BioY [Alphaproteobacteria bacterium]
MSEAPMALAGALWRVESERRLLRGAILAVAGGAFLVACSKVNVPLWPVPITLQTYAVLLIGAAYGLRLAVGTILLYLAVGLAGVPVFAGPTGGPGVLLGPTGGYLVGWVGAVAVVGWLAERGWTRTLPKALAALLAGNAAIYLLGLPWLALFVAPEQVLATGLTPFLVGDGAKLVLAAITSTQGWRLARGLANRPRER